MKNLLFTLCVACSLNASPYELFDTFDSTQPLSTLDNTIKATQTSLQSQMQLKERLQAYLEVQNRYQMESDNNELLFKVSHLAKDAITLIDDANLKHSFEPRFYRELNHFATLAPKLGIPKTLGTSD